MGKKFLHILTNDSKHINCLLNIFGKAASNSMQCDFIIINRGSKKISKTMISNREVKLIPLKFSLINRIISNYNVVFLHCLDEVKQLLLYNAPDNIEYVWLIWGADFYEFQKKARTSLYEKITVDRIVKRRLHLPDPKGRLGYIFKNLPFLHLIYNKTRRTFFDYFYNKALKRIDYICSFEEEICLIEKLTEVKFKHLKYLFNTLNDYIGDIEIKKIKLGNNIVTGNSATPTNNHLDTFDALKRFDFKEKKIVVPLTYGHHSYKEQIIKDGENIFKKQFKPLTSFLPRSEYNDILLSCNIMIMNHIRQQAIGNIMAGLYFGMKVYLNKKSPVCDMLLNKDIIFYNIQDDLHPENPAALKPLPQESINKNRRIIEAHWSEENVLLLAKNIYDEF